MLSHIGIGGFKLHQVYGGVYPADGAAQAQAYLYILQMIPEPGIFCVLGSPVINTHNGSNQSSYGCRRRKRIGNHRGSGVGFAEKSHVPRYIKY
jgi:hypothetical protein